MQSSVFAHRAWRARRVRALLAALAATAASATAAAQPITSPEPPPPGNTRDTSDTGDTGVAAQAPAPVAATSVIVTGRVIDSLGKPVAGAHVTLEAAATTLSDSAGRFRISAPLGATLIVDRDGYDVTLASVLGETLEVTLLAAGTRAEMIEVRGEAPPASPGAAKLDRNELQRIPGGGGDIVRTLTAMPGVVNLQIPLGYTGVVIRGASPQDSKVLIDGFEVPMLFHDVGLRSVVPAEAIESLDYIPGGFEVGFGRTSSGLVNLTTRPGSATRSEQAELSVVDGGVMAQGTVGRRTRYMFGVRRSTIDLLLPSLIGDADLSLTTVPRYYDAQLRVDHELSASWNLMVSALAADDLLEIVGSKNEDAEAKRFRKHSYFARATVSAQYRSGPWSATLALSGMAPTFDATNGLYQRIKFSYPMVTPRAELRRTAARAAGLTDVVWTAGAEAQVTRANVDIAIGTEPREGEPPPMVEDPKDVSETFKGVIWMPDAAAWTSLAANVGSRVRVVAGARGDVYGRAGEFVVQPRGELQLKLAPELTARLSAGLYTRPPEYQSEVLDKTLHAERSTQTIAGLTYEPFSGARVQTSAYYTDRRKMIVHAVDDDSLTNDGRGTTMGAELLATYRNAAWFTWLSYAYSHSTRIDHPGMARRLFDYDQPHSLNAAASWKHGRWQLGGRFQIYSGLPYTPATGSVLDSDRNVYMPVYAGANSERAPLHHQLDLRIDYSWRWGPAALTAFADVQNVYMNESVVTYFYSYDFSQRSSFKSLPLLPSIGLRGVL